MLCWLLPESDGSMAKQFGLTEGSIAKSLIKLAVPIMSTSFVQMAYSLTDMFWLGRISTMEVAAVGTASFFVWLAMMLILIPRTGAEVEVSQSFGAKDHKRVNEVASHSLILAIAFAIGYMLFILAFMNQLVGFFNLKSDYVVKAAKEYLTITALFMVPQFLNPVFTGILIGAGNSRLPFLVNTAGMVMNAVLDPLLIFNRIPGLNFYGAKGAAIASVIAHTCVMITFLLAFRAKAKGTVPLSKPEKVSRTTLTRLLKLGAPVGLHSGLFSIIAIILARFIAEWGDAAIAVQKVGSQIESLTWMTVGGFSSAICTFTGQNYGARRMDRVRKGYLAGLGLVLLIGLVNTAVFFFFSEQLFSLFLNDPHAVQMGSDYMRILSISQIFVCIEMATTGAFNGIGKTMPPSAVGIVFTALRIPGVVLLLGLPDLGLNSIWWVITVSSIFKGILLFLWFFPVLKGGYVNIQETSKKVKVSA